MTSDPGVPVVVDGAEVEEYAVGAAGDEGTIRRLIGSEQGSAVLFGTFRLEPGQSGTFELPHANGLQQEIYHLQRGRLRIAWDGGDLVAEPGHTVLFPAGGGYEIETIGQVPVELLWTGYPAPAPL
jgi:ethanolamine utilization protein EutQ (cupin superfamily)